MPEESSADEHAIIEEITAPLGSLPDNAVPAVADVEFPIALRGYDRLAVDAYVKRTSQLVAELQATRSPEAAVRRALERVGEEVAGILQRAHEAAAQITTQSRREAEDRLEQAGLEAAQITADSRRRLKELDAETDRIWAERHQIVGDAQQLAKQLLELADAAAERFPAADDIDVAGAPGSPAGEVSGVGELAGEAPAEPDEYADEPVFGGEPAAEQGADEPPGVEYYGEQPPGLEQYHEPPSGVEDYGEEPPGVQADAEAVREFDGDPTVIMPPIAPDDRQGP